MNNFLHNRIQISLIKETIFLMPKKLRASLKQCYLLKFSEEPNYRELKKVLIRLKNKQKHVGFCDKMQNFTEKPPMQGCIAIEVLQPKLMVS